MYITNVYTALSYCIAGHYIPSFAFKILMENDLGNKPHVNLQGVAIGDGLTCPCIQVEAGPRAAFDFGLISAQVFARAKGMALEASIACDASNWTAAHEYRESMEALVLEASGVNPYDIRTFDSYDYMHTRMDEFFNKKETKDWLHVPQQYSFQTDAGVSVALYDDVMQSQAYKLPFILEKVRVLLYQGQFDWKDGPFSNEVWLDRLDWNDRAAYLTADRNIWLSATESDTTQESLTPAGWVQSYGNLTECIINAAGHLAPMNQPQRLMTMITHFVSNEPFKLRV